MVERRKESKPRKPPIANATESSPLSLALRDASALGAWVFLSSLNEEMQLTALLSNSLGVHGMVAGLAVLVTTLVLYDQLRARLFGASASFNASQLIAFAGAGQGSLGVHCLRTVAQALGGLVGAVAALRLVPHPWRGKFGNYAHGVAPGNSILAGALTEAALAFVLNLTILWSTKTKHKTLAGLAPYIATVILIPAGVAFASPPFMNPGFAFAWFAPLRGASLAEHVAVYWLGCLAGAYLAGLAWWALQQPAKARRSRVRPRGTVAAAAKPQRAAAAGGKKRD